MTNTFRHRCVSLACLVIGAALWIGCSDSLPGNDARPWTVDNPETEPDDHTPDEDEPDDGIDGDEPPPETRCEVTRDEVVDHVPGDANPVNADLTVDSKGVPRLAWASHNRLYFAERSTDGWTVRSSQQKTSTSIDAVDLASRPGKHVMAVSKELIARRPTRRVVDLISPTNWSELRRFDLADEVMLNGPTLFDRAGDYYIGLNHGAPPPRDEDESKKTSVFSGSIGSLQRWRRKVDEHEQFIVWDYLRNGDGTASLVHSADGDPFVSGDTETRYYTLRSLTAPKAPDRTALDLKTRPDVHLATNFARDGDGSVYALVSDVRNVSSSSGRTTTLARRDSGSGSWSTTRLFESDANGRLSHCPDGDAESAPPKGDTCEFDHTQFSHRRLVRSRGRVFAVALRSHESGTATWECGEHFNDLPDRSGCGWTIPDSETEADETLMVGDVSNGTSDLRPISVDGGFPYDRNQVPTQTSFVVRGGHPWSTETEGDGTLHFALLGSAEDRYEKSAVRYLALRCP